ncbi:MAG: IclR family transcriptional regulator [Sphingomonadales bacterium]
MTMATPRNASVINAFDILRLIAAEGAELTLDRIAERLGLSRAATHRLIATLQDTGAVIRLHRNAYMPGPVIAELGAAVDITGALATMAREPVRRLVRGLQEVVHLGAFDGEMVTYLVKGSPRRKTIVPTEEGTQLEAYSSGVGKALLAYLPDPDLDQYLSDAPFVALTDHTITDPEAMRAALAEVRMRGYAMDAEEVIPGLTCLAVPILSPSGQAVASLSVSAATERFTPAFRDDALVMLCAEVGGLATRLFGSSGAATSGWGQVGAHRTKA